MEVRMIEILFGGSGMIGQGVLRERLQQTDAACGLTAPEGRLHFQPRHLRRS